MNLPARWRWKSAGELSLEDRNIRYFSIDTACQGLIIGGISAFISVFVVRLGGSSLLVSLLTSLPALVGAVLSIPVGWFIDRQQNLVRVTNAFRLIHRGGFLLVALLPSILSTGVAEAVVVLWAINAVPAAFINLSWTAVVAEIIPPRRRASVNGFRWALLSLVTAVSVAAYGNLLERVPFPVGYQIVFAISFLGGLLSMHFFSLLRLPSADGGSSDTALASNVAHPERAVVRANPTAHGATFVPSSALLRLRTYTSTIIGVPAFVRFLAATFLLRFGLNLPAALYSIFWVRELNASDLWIGWRATASSLALIVGYYLWGRIATRRGHHLVLTVCTIGMGAYPVLTGLISSQVWLPLVAVVSGFFVTGIDLAFFDTLLHVCPPDKRSSFVAVNVLFANLAIFLAPMTGSLLTGWLDLRMVFFLAGGLHLLALGLFVLWRVGMEEDEES